MPRPVLPPFLFKDWFSSVRMKNIKLSCIRLTYMCYILLICDKKQMDHQIPSESGEMNLYGR